MEEQTLQKTDWFNGLIVDCQSIVTEAEFISRWTIIQGYHDLGERISQEKENFTRSEIYGKQIVKLIAEKINKSESSVDKAMRFYEKYPDLQLLPEGKNVSWWKICQKYLPEPKKELVANVPEEKEKQEQLEKPEESINISDNNLDAIVFTPTDILDLFLKVGGSLNVMESKIALTLFVEQLATQFTDKEIETFIKEYLKDKT